MPKSRHLRSRAPRPKRSRPRLRHRRPPRSAPRRQAAPPPPNPPATTVGDAADGLEIDHGAAGRRGRKADRAGTKTGCRCRHRRLHRLRPRRMPPAAVQPPLGGASVLQACQARLRRQPAPAPASNRICGRCRQRQFGRRLARAVAGPAQIASQCAAGGVAADHRGEGKQHRPRHAAQAGRRTAWRRRRGGQDLRHHGREQETLRNHRVRRSAPRHERRPRPTGRPFRPRTSEKPSAATNRHRKIRAEKPASPKSGRQSWHRHSYSRRAVVEEPPKKPEATTTSTISSFFSRSQ